MAIVIRRLLDSEIALANGFFNSIYKTNRLLDHFRWEFLEGPNGPAVYVIAIDDSIGSHKKIVGIQCAIPLNLWTVRGDTILTAKSEDTLVDPEYRGKKIFERMYELLFQECKKAGISFIWGFTPARKAFERIGFQIPFQAHQALMVFEPVKAYSYLSSLNSKNRTSDRIKIAGLTFLSRLFSVFRSRDSNYNFEVEKNQIGSKEATIEKLCRGSKLFYLKMNDEYIRWRINENPFKNQYENYQFFSDGAILADIVLNFRPEGFGYIEQIVFGHDVPEEVKKQIILHVIGIMRKRVAFIRVLCFDINPELRFQTSLLKKCGFIVLRRGSHFVWRSTDGVDMNPNNIFLTRFFTQGNQ